VAGGVIVRADDYALPGEPVGAAITDGRVPVPKTGRDDTEIRMRNLRMIFSAHRVLSRGVMVLAAAALAGGAVAAAAVPGLPVALAAHATMSQTLYVSPGGSPGKSDTSCSTAAYSAIQSAVTAAQPGATVYVCAGTYAEQVTISTARLTLTGAGATSVIDPTTSSPSTVSDSDTLTPIVPIVDVTPGTAGVKVSNLLVDGSGLTANFSWPGCTDNFVGILYQAASGSVADTSVQNVLYPADLIGCQGGEAILAEDAPSGTANAPTGRSTVTIENDTVTTYDKNGVTCNDPGTTCTISQNTVTASPTSATAQNGVQIGFGAGGQVSDNQISGNDYTGATNTVEPAADYAAGILLYGAEGTTDVEWNTLTGNQIGVETVHSSAVLSDDRISETSPGITDSIGVFSVPCDYYCSYAGLSGGTVAVRVTDTTITFPGFPVPGTDGIWLGDGAASSTGTVNFVVAGDHISGAAENVVLGPTARGTVTVG
jgi:hypothetical protein